MSSEPSLAISPLFFPTARYSAVMPDGEYLHFNGDNSQVGSSHKDGRRDVFHHYDAEKQEIGFSAALLPQYGWAHYTGQGVRQKTIGQSFSMANGAFHHFDADNKGIGYTLAAELDGVYRHHGEEIGAVGIRPSAQPRVKGLFGYVQDQLGSRIEQFAAKHPGSNPLARKILQLIGRRDVA